MYDVLAEERVFVLWEVATYGYLTFFHVEPEGVYSRGDIGGRLVSVQIFRLM